MSDNMHGHVEPAGAHAIDNPDRQLETLIADEARYAQEAVPPVLPISFRARRANRRIKYARRDVAGMAEQRRSPFRVGNGEIFSHSPLGRAKQLSADELSEAA